MILQVVAFEFNMILLRNISASEYVLMLSKILFFGVFDVQYDLSGDEIIVQILDQFISC